MADENKEQNIDQQFSTSQIDQITKVPIPRPEAKVKNPKKVAAGKKLSEYNKKAKEQQKFFQENDDEEENNNSGDNQWLPKTSFTSIIALLGLGLTALDLFLRYKSQRNDSKNYENPNENPIESTNSDVTKIKVLDMKHNAGME